MHLLGRLKPRTQCPGPCALRCRRQPVSLVAQGAAVFNALTGCRARRARRRSVRKPPSTGPVGRALQDTRMLGWVALEGWWKWRLPGQAAPLHLALDDWGEVCHRVRESQRFSALQALERRRPRTYGGLGGAVQRDAVRHALTVACNELELVLLRSQLAGATWTAARAHEHRIRTDPRCPHCGAPPKRTSTCCGPAPPGSRHGRHGAR